MQLNHRTLRRRRGVTLIEVTISTLLVGLIVVGALRCLAASTRVADASASRTIAALMAEQLMEEILQQEYSEPDDTPAFGIEGAEVTTNRTLWDDVDDYDDWMASPPEEIDGTAIATAEWSRSVSVAHVQSGDLTVTEPDTTDTGIKRITVTVARNGVTAAELTTVQTRAWISMVPEFGNHSTTGQAPPTNEAPSAVIDPHTSSGTGSVSVIFDAGNSTDPEDQPLEYNWDFGDGDSSTSESETHIFLNTGTQAIVFTVTLTVIDIHGGLDSVQTTVTVYPN